MTVLKLNKAYREREKKEKNASKKEIKEERKKTMETQSIYERAVTSFALLSIKYQLTESNMTIRKSTILKQKKHTERNKELVS